MNKYKTLLSNTLLISMGTFGSKLLVFLMVRFYTSYLTPSDYSTADLITQTANLLFPIISMGLADAVFRFAMDENADRKSVFSTGVLMTSAGALLFAAVIPLLSFVDEFKGYVWLIVAYTMAAAYHSLCSYYIRAIGKTALFAIQGIFNTAMVIALNIIFLAVFNWGVMGYVLSVIVADSICTLFLFLKEKLWRVVTLKVNGEILPKMLKYSLPLIPTTIFWWITSVSDRYMVNEIIDSHANGIYTVSYKLPTLLTLVSTIFMQAWQFSAVSEDRTDDTARANFFSSVWRSFQAVMFLAGSVVIAFAKPAMKLLTTAEFYSAWQYIPLLSAAMVFTAFVSFLGSVYVVTKKSNISFLTSIPGPVINIALNFLLIPSVLGVQGAAIATVISYFAVFVIRIFDVRRYIKFKIYGWHIILNTVILFTQAAIMILSPVGWIPMQIICVALLTLVNAKFLLQCAEKILTPIFRRIRK